MSSDEDRGSLAGAGALVTGGAGGLGSAIARRLAADGARVTLMGRTESALQDVVGRIRSAGSDAAGDVDYVVGDAKVEADVVDALAHVDRRGGLAIAVPVVGGGTMGPVLLTSPDTFIGDLAHNTLSAYLVIRHATPLMAAAGGGSIVCISSDAASIPFPYMAGYCAGKSALDALVRVAALEHGHLGVRINSVRPGLVRTDSVNSRALFARDDIIELFVEEKPLGRTGVPEDVAGVVRFLAGSEAAWVTGQSWSVEGGNELTKAPSLLALVRERWGDEAVDAALAGRIPDDLLAGLQPGKE